MRHFHRAAADVERRAAEFVDAQGVETEARADDVHDRVDGADFVEMDFFERRIVNIGFSLAQFLKNGGGAIANLRCEFRGLQNV